MNYVQKTAPQYHNGFFPAQLLMGQNIKSTIPTVPKQLTPKISDRKTFKEKEDASRINQKQNFDNGHKVYEMKPLSSGKPVFITNMKCRGKVIQRASTPRAYLVDASTAVIRRNLLHLRIIPGIPLIMIKSNQSQC